MHWCFFSVLHGVCFAETCAAFTSYFWLCFLCVWNVCVCGTWPTPLGFVGLFDSCEARVLFAFTCYADDVATAKQSQDWVPLNSLIFSTQKKEKKKEKKKNLVSQNCVTNYIKMVAPDFFRLFSPQSCVLPTCPDVEALQHFSPDTKHKLDKCHKKCVCA